MRWLLATLLLLPCSMAGAAPRTKVAVMDVKNVQGVPEGTATILTEIVVSEVARHGVDVVSKADIAAIVGFEKEKTILGCSDDSSCLADIGGALGVDYMLTGQVGQIGSRYRISLILVDVKKGKVAARSADFCDKNEDALANAALARVREIMGVALAPPPPARADRADKSAVPLPPPPLGTTATPAPQAAPEAPPAPGSWSRRKIVGVSMTAGGGALLAGGLVFGLRARKLDADLKSSSNDIGYYYSYPSKRDEVKRTALIADVLYGLGLATAGVGGYLWFTDRPSPVALVPVVGDGAAGLVAMGRF